MSWYDEMVATGRSKSLTTGNIRNLFVLMKVPLNTNQPSQPQGYVAA